VAGWREAGRALGMSERDLESYADAFEHPERAAALKFTS
jgi:serine/threonine-protein kinase HipA